MIFEFVERREHYDGYGTAAASRGAASGSAQRSLRLQQDFDRPPYTAEPGTPSHDGLKLLASWAATQDEDRQPATSPTDLPNT